MFKTPILFLTYKRYETTEKVFNQIAQIKPCNFFFVSNAPNPSNYQNEIASIKKIRNLSKQITWDCKLNILFRDEHLQVRESIVSSINWFYESVEEGIILEDDCLPSLSFFYFCEDLLNRFRHDDNIFSINGSCFYSNPILPANSYMLSNHNYVWGWATWRRSWELYSKELSDWPRNRNLLVKKIWPNSFFIRSYWRFIFQEVFDDNIKTWDYQMLYTMWNNRMYSIIPNMNLVSNIGFGIDATFTKDNTAIGANCPSYEIDFPLYIPSRLQRNLLDEEVIQKNNFIHNKLYYVFNYYRSLFREYVNRIR